MALWKPARRVTVACLSDTHGGCKLGLLNPKTVLHSEDIDGNLIPYTPQLTAVQQWLWQGYTEDIGQVVALAGNDEIVVIHHGDINHGNKYPEELVSTRPADQIEIGVMIVKPWEAHRIRAMRLMFGTGAHSLGEGTTTIEVAARLGRKARAVNHGLFTVDGVTIDCAHHGAFPGSRNWLKGNIVRYYTRSIMYDAILRGEAPPRVVIRGHYHEWVHETVRLNGYVTDSIVLPAYCGLTGHGRQATRSAARISVGMAALEIVDGELRKIHPFYRVQDLRTREEL